MLNSPVKNSMKISEKVYKINFFFSKTRTIIVRRSNDLIFNVLIVDLKIHSKKYFLQNRKLFIHLKLQEFLPFDRLGANVEERIHTHKFFAETLLLLLKGLF